MFFFPISARSLQMSTWNPLRSSHPNLMHAKYLTAVTRLVLKPENVVSGIKMSIIDCINDRFLILSVGEGTFLFPPQPTLRRYWRIIAKIFFQCSVFSAIVNSSRNLSLSSLSSVPKKTLTINFIWLICFLFSSLTFFSFSYFKKSNYQHLNGYVLIVAKVKTTSQKHRPPVRDPEHNVLRVNPSRKSA